MLKNPGTPSTAASDGTSTVDTAPSRPSQNGTMAEYTQQSYSPTRRTAGRTNPSASAFLAAHQPSGMSIIRQAYGPNADLYQDVLHVDPSASDREVRTAYFRRGKQVLNKFDDVPGVDNKQDVDDTPSIAAVSHRSKLQFQAVSAAYDILSDPSLRSEYDATGTVAVADNSSTASPVKLKATSNDVGIGSVKMQRSRSQNTPYRKKKTSIKGEAKQAVRWSKTVEELVIQNDCVSIASRRSWNCGGSLDSVNDGDGDGDGDGGDVYDNASVMSIDSAASSVKETLRRLDDSAEMFTRQEFLDELEFSVQSLLHAASRDIADVATSGTLSDNITNKNTDKTEDDDNGSKSSVRRRLSFGFKKDKNNKKEADGTNISTTDKKGDCRSSGLLGTVLTIGSRQPKKATSSASPTSMADSSNREEATSRDVPASAATAADTKTEEEKDKQNEGGSSDDFYLYLSTYICGVIQEIKGSLDHVGSMCSDGTCSGVIQEKELDSLVHMLRSEVEQQEDHPFDEPETASPLGTTIETFDTESVPSTLAMERNDVETAPAMA